MTLTVHTARISYGGRDRFDVTRKSGGAIGEPFAPSWRILQPMLEARKRWSEKATHPLIRGGEEARLWAEYVDEYTFEMRESYRTRRGSWDELLARESVTLVCYCTDAEHCHRRLLAEILVKLGATYAGERS